MKKKEAIFILFLSFLCLQFTKVSAEETTIIIDDFSSATGRVVSYSQSDDYSTGQCVDNCLEQTICKNQSSSSIPGGFRYSSTQILTYFTNPNQFSWQEEGFIEVSNNTWEASVNLTNNGTSSWDSFTFFPALQYLRPCFIYSNDISMNLLIGGGNFIAVNIEATTTENFTNKLGFELVDIYNKSFYRDFEPTMFDPEIGQYLIDMESKKDFDFSSILEFRIFVLFSNINPIPPNTSVYCSLKISNLRVISISNGETSQASSQSSLSSLSSKSSRELSSDSSLTISFFSFYLLIVILFLSIDLILLMNVIGNTNSPFTN